jgi:septum formation protein
MELKSKSPPCPRKKRRQEWGNPLQSYSVESILMLVLASASPRRRELLRSAGISFVVQAADVDETPLTGESARECAERLAREKALAVWRKRPDDVVLGADTVVVVEGAILGKPVDATDAARMLRMLSGRVHEVITGVCVVKSGARGQGSGVSEITLPDSKHARTAAETTLVTMSPIADRDILDYVATGEPMDKAGAYAIQGIASRWIPRIEGDYSNVVGLPVALVYRMLKEGGYEL